MENQTFPPMMNMTALMEPSRRMARLMIEQTERLINLELECARAYGDLAMEDLRAALSVSDGDSLRRFLEQHNRLMTTAAQRMGDDLQSAADLGRSFGEETRRIGEENLKKMAETTQPGGESAAKAA